MARYYSSVKVFLMSLEKATVVGENKIAKLKLQFSQAFNTVIF